MYLSIIIGGCGFIRVWSHYIGTTIVGLVAFYGGNLGFMFLDVTGKPSLLHKYKIQETKNVPVSVCMCVIITCGTCGFGYLPFSYNY